MFNNVEDRGSLFRTPELSPNSDDSSPRNFTLNTVLNVSMKPDIFSTDATIKSHVSDAYENEKYILGTSWISALYRDVIVQ